MVVQEFDQEKLQYFMTLITDMQLKGVNLKVLGDIALDILVARNRNEQVLDGDYPQSKKEHAKKNLAFLKDLEKRIVSLYIMGRLSGEKWTEYPLFDYITKSQKYDWTVRRK